MMAVAIIMRVVVAVVMIVCLTQDHSADDVNDKADRRNDDGFLVVDRLGRKDSFY